jgi:hypothetical protein
MGITVCPAVRVLKRVPKLTIAKGEWPVNIGFRNHFIDLEGDKQWGRPFEIQSAYPGTEGYAKLGRIWLEGMVGAGMRNPFSASAIA